MLRVGDSSIAWVTRWVTTGAQKPPERALAAQPALTHVCPSLFRSRCSQRRRCHPWRSRASASRTPHAAAHANPSSSSTGRCAPGDACFIQRKPIALEAAPVRRLVQALGVTLARPIGDPPIECGTLFRKVCRAEGTIGTESVWVWVQPPEVRTHERRTPRNRRTFQAFRVLPGTEIDVSVLGHCLHPTECEELQHEQAEALFSPR
jgi:hypothetical protein